MKTSIYTWFGYFMPFKERLELIKYAGFDEVIVSWEDEYPPYYLSRLDFRKEIDRVGLGITNAHSPFIGYNRIWEDPPQEKTDLLTLYCDWIRELDDFGIDTLVVHTNDTDLSDYNIDYGLQFFDELSSFAQKYDFTIAVENVTRQFLLKKVLDEFKNESIGLCYDCGHDFITPCGSGRLLSDYGDRIRAVHLHDNNHYVDKHWLPGEGELDYSRIMPQIFKSGYDTVALEVKADPAFWAGREASEFLRSAYQSAQMLQKYNKNGTK